MSLADNALGTAEAFAELRQALAHYCTTCREAAGALDRLAEESRSMRAFNRQSERLAGALFRFGEESQTQRAFFEHGVRLADVVFKAQNVGAGTISRVTSGENAPIHPISGAPGFGISRGA